MKRLALIGLLALAAIQPGRAAEKPSARWMAHCADNLKRSDVKPAIVRKYCACMAGLGDEAEMLTWSQSDLEHSYPPAHAQCHDQARGRRARGSL